jgi:hypothetical protein
LCKRKKREEKEIEMYRDMIGERWWWKSHI